MRSYARLVLAGLVLLAACDNAADPVVPDLPEPSYHEVTGVPESDANNAYSMYYFDLDLRNDILLKMAQWGPEGGSLAAYKCYDFETTHNDLGDQPAFDAIVRMGPAQGFGTFKDRRGWPTRRGYLFVTQACWFDEWNGEGGFPESAWVAGFAVLGWRQYHPFRMMLKSGGFPVPYHLVRMDLDLAKLSVGPYPELALWGELHHEDDTRLLQ